MNKYIKVWNTTTNNLIETAKLLNENLSKKELAKEQLEEINKTRPNQEKNLLEQEYNEEQKEYLIYLFTLALKGD